MKTATHQKSPDTYMRMIRLFPLRPIRNQAECDRATAILDQHITAVRPDRGLSDYLQVLLALVEDYERKNNPVTSPQSTPVQRLKHLMSENGMTVAELGRLLGNSGLASMILHGKRGISKTNARILANRFGVSVAAFI